MNKILIVEDNSVEAEDFKIQLTLLGYDVKTAISSVEALEAIPKFLPDLVLMDIGLDLPDGIDTAKAIKEHGFNIPVVFLTQYNDKDTLQRAELTEPYGYVVKSAKEEILNIVIANALARRKAEIDLQRNLEAQRDIGNLDNAVVQKLAKLRGLLTEVITIIDSLADKEPGE
jgi:CheY-like chemotaxis protein